MKISRTIILHLGEHERFEAPAQATYSGTRFKLRVDQLEVGQYDHSRGMAKVCGAKVRADGTPGAYTSSALIKLEDMPKAIQGIVKEEMYR